MNPESKLSLIVLAIIFAPVMAGIFVEIYKAYRIDRLKKQIPEYNRSMRTAFNKGGK
jgi:hypothetical protein